MPRKCNIGRKTRAAALKAARRKLKKSTENGNMENPPTKKSKRQPLAPIDNVIDENRNMEKHPPTKKSKRQPLAAIDNVAVGNRNMEKHPPTKKSKRQPLAAIDNVAVGNRNMEKHPPVNKFNRQPLAATESITTDFDLPSQNSSINEEEWEDQFSEVSQQQSLTDFQNVTVDFNSLSNDTSIYETQWQDQSLEVAQRHLQSAAPKNKSFAEEFFSTINTYMDMICACCKCRFFPKQVNQINKNSLMEEIRLHFANGGDIVTICKRCARILEKKKIPSIAFWNNLDPGNIPLEISQLTKFEKLLLSRFRPFIEIVKLEGKFGQFGLKGQTLLYAQDITEIQNQLLHTLPRTFNDCQYVMICERLENISRDRQFKVDLQKIETAFNWLLFHNPLYKDVQFVAQAEASYSISQCAYSLNNPSDFPLEKNSWEFWNLMEDDTAILMGNVHINEAMFDISADALLELHVNVLFVIKCFEEDPAKWNRKDVDLILYGGYDLAKKYLNKQIEITSPKGPTDLIINCVLVNQMEIRVNNNTAKIFFYQLDYNEISFGNTIKDFNEALLHISNRFDKGIIECNGRSVAFAIKNDFFFLFNCQNCGPKGHPCKSKNNLSGFSCVLRFSVFDDFVKRCRINLKLRSLKSNQVVNFFFLIYALSRSFSCSLDSAHENIVQNVDENNKSSTSSDMTPEIHFQNIDDNVQILRAAGKQIGNSCTANCIIALIKAQMHPNSVLFWNTEDLDTILMFGRHLYDSIIISKDYERNQLLLLDDIPNEMELFDCRVCVDYPAVENLDENIEIDINNLEQGLQSLFALHSFGIIMGRSKTLAVMKICEYFYLFDPHGCDNRGYSSCSGKACLIRSTELMDVIQRCQINLAGELQHLWCSLSFVKLVSIEKINIEQPVGIELTQQRKEPACISQLISQSQSYIAVSKEQERFHHTSLLMRTDQNAPLITNVLDFSNVDPNSGEVPLHILRRKTEGKPVNIYIEKKAEEIAWYHLFPYRINGLNENRTIPITPLDYFRTRVMGSDPRFHSIEYLAFALSTYENLKASQMVSVCGRIRQNDKEIENIASNIHLMMKKIRGSYAYWNNQYKDLTAMVKCLGPPGLFLTLSSNDLNWPDVIKECLLAEERTDDPSSLSFEERVHLIENNPIALSRKFMVRVHAIMKFLKHDDSVLGKIEDLWWRIEFQKRGSPHLHSLLWIENMPDLYTEEGIRYLDRIMSCKLPDDDEELKNLVLKCQTHKHTHTCTKRGITRCRFGFPRRVCEKTRMLPADSVDFRKTDGRVCELERRKNEENINNYNPQLLRLWQGNMDIQPCSSVEDIVEYIVKYASKAEPKDINEYIQNAIKKCSEQNLNLGKKLFSVSMALLNHREVCGCEMAFRLCHLQFKCSSRSTVFLNTSRPEERFRMLAVNENQSNRYYQNIFDRYENRPDNLEELCLLEFAMWYEPYYFKKNFTEDEENADKDAYSSDDEDICNFDDRNVNAKNSRKPIKLKDGKSFMMLRKRHAVVRTRNFSIQKNRDSYYYNLLVLLVPFRSEIELMVDQESAEESFLNKKHMLSNSILTSNYLRLSDEVEAAIENAELNENDRLNIQSFHNSFDFDANEENDPLPPMEENVFKTNIGLLNSDQKQVFEKVRSHIQKDLRKELRQTETFKVFVTGGAGTGKSFLLKMLKELIQRMYYDNNLPSTTSYVKIGAPTGAAAKLIGGSTLHSMLRLPLDLKTTQRFIPLEGEYLSRMQREWKHVKFLIIDEISMVSYEMLVNIHLRLQNIMGNDLLFGGVNIIVFGDLLQLNPVKGKPIYMQPLYRIGEMFLWRTFGFIELKVNMRQRNDCQFIDLLNNVRFGKVTAEDAYLLLSRLRTSEEIEEFEKKNENVVKIVSTNKEANNFNKSKLADLVRLEKCKLYKIKALDRLINTNEKQPENFNDIIPQDEKLTAGVSSVLYLAVGAKVMLRKNISVAKGLVNGSMGTIVSFQWRHFRLDQLNDEDIPASVTVDFGDCGIHPIEPFTVTFEAKKRNFGKIERTQLPLILAWSVTAHKLQGSTIDNAIINLGKKTFAKGQPYVMLSRCKTLESIVFDEIDIQKIQKLVNTDAIAEMTRLRSLSTA